MTYLGKRSTENGHRIHLSVVLAALFCNLPAVALGDIFRYQDERGNWHFTDDPPERYESSVVLGITKSKSAPQPSAPTDDLADRLRSAFDPITPIAYATLAVVSIKTATGEASGFFCSEQGHILTNKHVVRPDAADTDDGRKESIQDQSEQLSTLTKSLDQARGQLQLMEKDLKGYADLIESAREDDTRSWAKDAHQRLSLRYRAERGRTATMDRDVRGLKSELRSSKRKLSYQHNYAAAKERFDVVLKDGTELIASLVETSNTQDLALLKLDGYRTPFLKLASAGSLSQGIRVFALGNPLGLQDMVTSGVVTQIAPGHLLTDAQILPGSSGGPLILESGEVIGINVSRRVAAGTSKYSAGFGKAIPSILALQEFPDAIASSGNEPSIPGQAQIPDSDQAWTLVPDGAGGFDARRVEAPSPGETWSFGPNDAGGPRAEQTVAPETERTWTFGPEGAINLGPGQLPPLRSNPAGGIRADRAAAAGSPRYGASDSEPVRLIIPDGDDDLAADQATEPEPRSLNFPPEGGGIPPGITRAQQ